MTGANLIKVENMNRVLRDWVFEFIIIFPQI